MQRAVQVERNLRDAGCCETFIREFLQVMEEGTPEEQQKMLERQRSCILQKVREEQKKLECFDYLRYQFRKVTER